MADEPELPKTNGDASDRAAFDYIKGQLFRVVHADGAIGSVTPNGNIHMAFFSERPAIPRRIVQRVEPTGRLSEILPNETISRGSIVREMDVDVMMTLDAARLIHQWLGQRIQEAEKRSPLPASDEPKTNGG